MDRLSKRINWAKACTLLSGLVLIATNGACVAKEKFVLQSQTAKMDRLPPPKLLQGSVGQSVMGGAPALPTNSLGLASSGDAYPRKVLYVAPNSLAWKAGVQAGDQILEAHATQVLAGMIVQRGAKKYFCMMDLSQLAATKPVSTAVGTKIAKEDTAAQRLTGYSIVMMVDSSASMGTLDCPGKKSRWQWCQEHIRDMYSEGNGMLQKNISIVTFDSNFKSYRDCSPSKLSDVFENTTPAGETNMGPALDEAFSLVRQRVERGQPAVISLISDGRPTDVESVKKSIITETNRLRHPELLSIVFIEVGTPEHYLHELDVDLVKQGAARDIISIVPFASVNSQPLTVTLSAQIPKEDKPSRTATLNGSASSENRARSTLDSHISGGAGPAPPPVVHPPIRPTPVVAAPPIKAHPAGTGANGEPLTIKTEVKPVEVDEKESVLKHAANKTY